MRKTTNIYWRLALFVVVLVNNSGSKRVHGGFVVVFQPASARGIGIQVIHKWGQLPRKRPLLVQKWVHGTRAARAWGRWAGRVNRVSSVLRYLHKPYLIGGNKFDLRIYVYVTCYDPLRVYIFSDGLVRFASCKSVSSSSSSSSSSFSSSSLE